MVSQCISVGKIADLALALISENVIFIRGKEKTKVLSLKSTSRYRPSINPPFSLDRQLLLIYHLAPYLLVFSNPSVTIFIILGLELGNRVSIKVRVSFTVSIRLTPFSDWTAAYLALEFYCPFFDQIADLFLAILWLLQQDRRSSVSTILYYCNTLHDYSQQQDARTQNNFCTCLHHVGTNDFL